MSVIVITGGSRGIGASAAVQCAQRGMGVIFTYNSNSSAAEAVVERISNEGGQAVALALDVSDTASIGAFKETVQHTLQTTWGASTLGGLVNNAGYGLYSPIASVTPAQFDGLMNVHLKGPFFLTQALLPLLEEGASIVNVTSATTRVATAGVAPYAAFKGGLEVLTRYMAKEFGERRIRANSVSPGAIRTDLGGGLSNEFETLLASQTALGRVGDPDDVGKVIAHLLSKESGWINAQSIEVSGGYIILIHGGPPMLDHVILSVRDTQRSIAFYTAVLTPLGITQRHDYDKEKGPPGHPDLKGFGANGRMFFWLREGIVLGHEQAHGRGAHIGFVAKNNAEVDAAYAAAMAAGAIDQGAPAARLYYDPRYYAANVLDPDGYSLELVYKSWQHA